MSSVDRIEIIKKVRLSADKYGATNAQQLKQLISFCKRASDREVFFGLFAFFYDLSLQENEFERQQLAGSILLSVSPSSPLELDGSVQLLKNGYR